MENDFFNSVLYGTEYCKLSNGELMAYRTIGTGSMNILLIHGHLTCSVNMEKLMGEFNEEEVKLIAPCLRGQGYSSYINTIKDFKDLAKDLQLFMLKSFKDETFYVMGHSMGGAVAMHLALLMPQRCLGLMLLNPLNPEGVKSKHDITTMEQVKKFTYKRELFEAVDKLDRTVYKAYMKKFGIKMQSRQ